MKYLLEAISVVNLPLPTMTHNNENVIYDHYLKICPYETKLKTEYTWWLRT